MIAGGTPDGGFRLLASLPDRGGPVPIGDEAMIRAGIRAILANDPEMTVVAEADDGDTAVELTRHRPDVALLDIRMPRLDGLSAAAAIRRLAPATGVVVLTTFGEDDYITRAVAAGAAGFPLKSGDPRGSGRARPTCPRGSPIG